MKNWQNGQTPSAEDLQRYENFAAGVKSGIDLSTGNVTLSSSDYHKGTLIISTAHKTNALMLPAIDNHRYVIINNDSTNNALVKADGGSIVLEIYKESAAIVANIGSEYAIIKDTNIGQNALINSNFLINQRVVSGEVNLAANTYGHDRWKAGASGCTYTFATVNNVTTITITAGSLIQAVEGLNLVSDNYTLSWQGTTQGKLNGGSYGDSPITATVTGGINTEVEFGTGTLIIPKLEIGTLATKYRHEMYHDELSKCELYYRSSYAKNEPPGSTNNIGAIRENATRNEAIRTVGVRFATRMRITPTVSIYAATTGTINCVENDGDKEASAAGISDCGISSVNVTNGVTTERCRYHYTADAEI